MNKYALPRNKWELLRYPVSIPDQEVPILGEGGVLFENDRKTTAHVIRNKAGWS